MTLCIHFIYAVNIEKTWGGNCFICACQVSRVVGALRTESPQPRTYVRGVCVFSEELHTKCDVIYCLSYTVHNYYFLIHVFCSALQIHTVTLIPGDGIGPEISSAVMKIFEAAKVSTGGAAQTVFFTNNIIQLNYRLGCNR